LDIKKTVRISASLLIIILIGYFYSAEVRKNWASLQDFKLNLNVFFLLVSLFFYLLSYLLDTYTWQVCIHRHLGRRELDFFQSIAVVNGSGLLKYLPGRIWTYTAQLLWLNKFNISKSLILYVNVLCIAGAMIVSLYLGVIYSAAYTDIMNTATITLAFAALIALNIIYISWNSLFMNKALAMASRILKREIHPIKGSKALLLFIQFMYACSWSLMGLGGYFLARGIGLDIAFTSIIALLASMSLSWLVGYLVILSPGGLGIREGIMLLMLNGVVNTQTALIFPILSRLMSLMAEALLGLVALSFGMKYNVFSIKKEPQ